MSSTYETLLGQLQGMTFEELLEAFPMIGPMAEGLTVSFALSDTSSDEVSVIVPAFMGVEMAGASRRSLLTFDQQMAIFTVIARKFYDAAMLRGVGADDRDAQLH